ncbi:rhodanese-like domain-containing protein [Desulfovibrio mangrovi]|uniref:rhodanese-like domain-containing protein n=1 Tax=Desulfovibrio mangrovi TaxID=2976983 RepID=UPI0022464914|nr:rhodanese-like domain-containing protein [Desulfovibrio mangrovi]UZP68106.1 rhodanese-like domain-containing protein [Desulfovibrio mangrovi]
MADSAHTVSRRDEGTWRLRMALRRYLFPFVFSFVLLLVVTLSSVWAEQIQRPVWWADMQAEAESEGYYLLEGDVASAGADVLVLDVRPDYEFRAGHVVSARNVEFPPTDTAGDEQLVASAVAAVAALAHGDRTRRIAVYCRSFR